MVADPNTQPRTAVAPLAPDSSISSGNGRPAGTALAPAGNSQPVGGLHRWTQRALVLLFVSGCAVFGVLLVILPWIPQWTDNRLLLMYPSLRPIVTNGFVRGLCSGLGLLDLWMGFWEATHYHEEKSAPK